MSAARGRAAGELIDSEAAAAGVSQDACGRAASSRRLERRRPNEGGLDGFDQDERHVWKRARVAGLLSFGIGLLWPYVVMDGPGQPGDMWLLAMICAAGCAGVTTGRQPQKSSDRDADMRNPFLIAFTYAIEAQVIGLIGAGVGMAGLTVGAIACEQLFCS